LLAAPDLCHFSVVFFFHVGKTSQKMIGKNSLLKTIHLEDLKTSYQVTGSSLLNQ